MSKKNKAVVQDQALSTLDVQARGFITAAMHGPETAHAYAYGLSQQPAHISAYQNDVAMLSIIERVQRMRFGIELKTVSEPLYDNGELVRDSEGNVVMVEVPLRDINYTLTNAVNNLLTR